MDHVDKHNLWVGSRPLCIYCLSLCVLSRSLTSHTVATRCACAMQGSVTANLNFAGPLTTATSEARGIVSVSLPLFRSHIDIDRLTDLTDLTDLTG